MPLKGRAAERPIASYNKGAFTSGEFLDFIRTQPPQVQSSLANASDDQLKTAIEQLTRKELLLQQAKARNVSLSPAENDSIRSHARQYIHQVLQMSGLDQLAGRKVTPAQIDQQVMSLFHAALGGQAQLVPSARSATCCATSTPARSTRGPSRRWSPPGEDPRQPARGPRRAARPSASAAAPVRRTRRASRAAKEPRPACSV